MITKEKNKNSNKSLERELSVRFLLVVILSGIFISLFLIIPSSKTIRDKSIETANLDLLAKVNSIEGNLDRYRGVLQTFVSDITAMSVHIEDETFTDFIFPMLQELSVKLPEIMEVYVAQPSGNIVFSSNYQPPADFDPTKRDWYLEATDEVRFTNPYIDTITQELVITATCAQIKAGEKIFVLGIDISMDQIVENIQNINLDKGSYPFLIGREGEVYFHPDSSYAPDADSFVLLDNRLTALKNYEYDSENQPPIKSRNYNKKNHYFFGQKFYSTDWVLCAAIPTSVFNQNTRNSIIFAVIITVLMCVAAGVVGVRAIHRMIVVPVKEIADIASRISIGDVSEEVAITRNDEIGELQQTFAEMVQSIQTQIECLQMISTGDYSIEIPVRSDKDAMNVAINDMLNASNEALFELRQAAAQVSLGSTQVAEGAQNLAFGSSEQAATLEEFSASVAEIKEQAFHSTQTSKKAKDDTMGSFSLMEQSQTNMLELSEAMEKIRISSTEIVRVSQVINDIAAQTNLLSLNAAIEAARAGEHGKGFAVVADEVRNLAAKSAEAALEAAELVQHSINNVETGTEFATKTAESLIQLAENSKGVVGIMDTLSNMSQGQSDSIQEINIAIAQFSQVVQANSGTAEESAAAAEEMNAQSEMLNGIVSKFKLNQRYNQ